MVLLKAGNTHLRIRFEGIKRLPNQRHSPIFTPLVSLMGYLKNYQVSRIVSFGRVRPLLPRSVARDRREARVGTSLPDKARTVVWAT